MARLALAVALVAGSCTPAAPAARRVTPTTTTAPPSTVPPVTTTLAPTVVVPSSVAVPAPPPVPPPGPAEGHPIEGMPGQDVTLACIRHWESRGNYRAVSRSGRYRGAYQFDRSTWAANGGSGDPAAASVEEQDRTAATLLSRRGLAPWPTPARRCA